MNGGFVAHIVAAYGGLRASMRAAMARSVREENLLALVMFGSFVVFLSFLPTLFSADLRTHPDQSIAAGLVMWFFVVMFFLPLALYGVAGLSHLIAMRFGARGTNFDARHALFWALAVLAPVLIVKSMLASVVMQIGGDLTPILRGTLNVGLLLAALRVWGATLAEAEQFQSTAKVTAAIAAVLLILYGLLYLMAR